MAIDRIAEKLNTYLKKDIPINSEAEALYFLVEIGKILESDKNNKFPLLKFYRDWACHPRKDKMIDEIVNISNSVYQDAIHHIQSPYDLAGQKAVLDFAGGGELKKQIEEFLQQYSLEKANLLVEKNWNWFVSMMGNVLGEHNSTPGSRVSNIWSLCQLSKALLESEWFSLS